MTTLKYTAEDAYGNTITSYTGPVTFSSTDGKAVYGTPSTPLAWAQKASRWKPPARKRFG